MKVFRSGELMSNALEREVEIQAYTNVKREALKRLNFILGFVADQNPGVITKYIENLQTQYQKLVQEDLIKKLGINLEEIIDEFDPFRDGKAANRIGSYLHSLIQGYEQGLDRKTILREAAEQYSERWGEDKIISG